MRRFFFCASHYIACPTWSLHWLHCDSTLPGWCIRDGSSTSAMFLVMQRNIVGGDACSCGRLTRLRMRGGGAASEGLKEKQFGVWACFFQTPSYAT